MLRKFLLFVIFFLLFVSIQFSEVLTIFHAGSLTKPLNELSRLFKQSHRNLEIRLESSGSLVVARKIIDLGKIPDLAFFADYRIFHLFLYPDYADFQVKFASNSIVLAFTEDSLFSDELNDSNWFDIILKSGVKFGFSNPDLDPCGYRTLMTIQLAEKYYDSPGLFRNFKSSPNALILKKSTDLVSYLQLGELDYAFLYKSEAVNSGLKVLELPAEINLGSERFAANYKTAVLEITGKGGKKIELHGEPILYSFTILKAAKNKARAIEFVKFLMSEKGKEIFKRYGFSILGSPIIDIPENLPKQLKGVF